MFDALFREGGLSLDRLRSFLEVADAKGISRAAPGNPVRQSQLSRQLDELETFFGRPLTEKEGTRRVLTEDGRRLAEHVRWMLAGLDDLKGARQEAKPTFVLAAGDSVLHWLVLPRLVPQSGLAARFEVVAAAVEDVIARLLSRRADLGVVRRDDVPPQLASIAIGEIEHALFVPKALVPRSVSDDEIVFRVPLALQVSDGDFRVRLAEHAAKHKRTLDVALRCETFPQVFRAVQSGRYAGLLPTLARAELSAARFRELRVAGRHHSRLHLAWLPSLTSVRPRAQQVVEELGRLLGRRT